MAKILFITTSAANIGDNETGIWFDELTTPYYIFYDNGFEVDIASPEGGLPPFSPESLEEDAITDSVRKFQDDEIAIEKIRTSRVLQEVNFNNYDAIFFPGGHGAMVDLPEDEILAKKLGDFFDEGKPIAAVCHGPAAFVGAKRKDGKSIVYHKKITSFTNSEEMLIDAEDNVPFLLEKKLRLLGANFMRGEDFEEFTVRDENLITGQNPASSRKCAELLVEALMN